MQTQLQITLTFPIEATPKEMAARLRMQAGILEGMPAKEASKAKPTTKQAAAETETVEEDDSDFQTDAAKNGASFDDDAPEETTDDDDFTDKKPAAKTAAKKAKKLTLDDVNDACKNHAQAKGRPATLAILKKKFKTESVSSLKPEQYEACISAMAVN